MMREKEAAKVKAAEVAIKKAAQDKKEAEVEVELEKELEVIGEEGVEKKAMEAFKDYKEYNDALTKKTTVTTFDTNELETRHNSYLAIKRAKLRIMRKKMMFRLKAMRQR
jgi:hypothetical protein